MFESHLLTEQFLKKRVKPVELRGKCLGLYKSFRHQHVLADENQIRNHDCDGPEQHLVHAGENGEATMTYVFVASV